MAIVFDALKQAGDLLLTAELAVVVVSAILGLGGSEYQGPRAARKG